MGVILTVRHPAQPLRGGLVSAPGTKPSLTHRVGLASGSPSQPQQGRQDVPVAPFGFCFCPVGKEADEVLFRRCVIGDEMKPTSRFL